MKTFEYKISNLPAIRVGKGRAEQLNELGKLGWELVSVIQHKNSPAMFYLKRQVSD